MNNTIDTDYPQLLGTPDTGGMGDQFDLGTHFLIVNTSANPLVPKHLGRIVSRTPGNYTNHCPGFARAWMLYADELGNCSVLVEKPEPPGAQEDSSI